MLLLILSALAVMATSTDNTVSADPETISFTLDRETSARAFRIESTFGGRFEESTYATVSYQASSDAMNPDADLGVRFDTETFGHPEVFAVVPTLRLPGPTHTIVFSLASPARNGPVTIELEIGADFDPGESSDASLDVSIVEDDDFQLEEPPPTARVEFQPNGESENFSLERVTLSSSGPAPGGSLTAELTVRTAPGSEPPTGAFVVTDQDGRRIELEPGAPTELALPSACDNGPCDYVLHVLRIEPLRPFESVRWQLDLSAVGIELVPVISRVSTAELRGTTSIPAMPVDDEPIRRTLIVDVSVPPGGDQAALFHAGFALDVRIADDPDKSDVSPTAEILDGTGRVVARGSGPTDADLLTQKSSGARLVPVVSGRNVFVLEISRRGRDRESDIQIEGAIAVTLHSSGPVGEDSTITLTVSDE